MATTNLKILSKILVALLGIWTLTTSCFEIIGITIKGLSDMKLRYDLPRIEEQ